MLAQVSSWRATRLLPSELQSLHLLNGNQVKKVKVLVALSSRLFVVPWTVARQAPLSMGILQARILEWVAIPFSRGSSRPRDRTQVSCTPGRFFTI